MLCTFTDSLCSNNSLSLSLSVQLRCNCILKAHNRALYFFALKNGIFVVHVISYRVLRPRSQHVYIYCTSTKTIGIMLLHVNVTFKHTMRN